MKIWVYDSLERCDSDDPPNAVGTLYADGVCRTIETDEPIGTDVYNKLPGKYKATCTNEGKIRFSDSGCLDDTCAVPGGNDGVCLRDVTIAGALFSRLSPPEYNVQQERNATTGSFFTCFKLDDSVDSPVTVTFVIFGDCSTCDPAASAAAPSATAPVTSPVGIPTVPVAAPTAVPVAIPVVAPTAMSTATIPSPIFSSCGKVFISMCSVVMAMALLLLSAG